MKPIIFGFNKFGLNYFSSLSRYQTLEGPTTEVKDDTQRRHYIFWDLEGYGLYETVLKLETIQLEFKLGDIAVRSDKKGSYRAFCWSKRPFMEYVHILVHTFPFVDMGFFIWTVRRNAGTLRLNNKAGRSPDRDVAFLKGYEETEFPEKLDCVIYDTGLEKGVHVLFLGDKNRLGDLYG